MGFTPPSRDYEEPAIDLNRELINDPDSTFMYRVNSTSMINAFITVDSVAIVDRSITPQNGDIVLARIEGKDCLRFLKKNNFKSWLCPANPKYQVIEITEQNQPDILGVVTHVVNNKKTWQHVCFG